MKKTRLSNRLLTFCLLLMLRDALVLAQPPGRSRPYVIIGYVTGSGWTKDQIEGQKLTHINYAFAVPAETGELAPLNARDSVNLAALTSLKTVNKDLKVLISIGGWGGLQVLFRRSPDGRIAPEIYQ